MLTLQRFERAVGGVELHRQRDKLEERDHAEEDNAEQQDRLAVEHKAEHQNDERGLRAELRRLHNGAAQLDGTVAHGVLHRVPRLMRGNADRRDRGGIVNGVGEKDGVIARIVVVGQLA